MAFCVSRGRGFQGTTIGLAPLKAMCSEYQSGGVNSVRNHLYLLYAIEVHELLAVVDNMKYIYLSTVCVFKYTVQASVFSC